MIGLACSHEGATFTPLATNVTDPNDQVAVAKTASNVKAEKAHREADRRLGALSPAEVGR
jgi:hypothetical protein